MMKRNVCLLSALSCILLFLPPLVHGAVEIGVSGHYAMFQESDYDKGFGLSALVQFNLGKSFALELSGGMVMVPTFNDNKGLGEGDLTLVPIQLSVFYKFNLSPKFAIRLGGGAGYAVSQFKLQDQGDWENLDFDVSQKLKPGPLFHGVLGLDWLVATKTTLFLEGRYVSGQLDGEYTFSDGTTTVADTWKEDLSYMTVSVGIRFSLKREPSVQRFVVPERTKKE